MGAARPGGKRRSRRSKVAQTLARPCSFSTSRLVFADVGALIHLDVDHVDLRLVGSRAKNRAPGLSHPPHLLLHSTSSCDCVAVPPGGRIGTSNLHPHAHIYVHRRNVTKNKPKHQKRAKSKSK